VLSRNKVRVMEIARVLTVLIYGFSKYIVYCKRRGRIYGGNQSVFTRCEILASNEMSGYEGCVKEEGEAVC
jgi:hypothetical protein